MNIAATVSTKGDAMYQALKQELLSGEIKAGQRLIIADLAKKHNVSPMPVREAIKRLQQEGWVDVLPHIGAVAKTTDLGTFKEIVAVRTELEVLATVTATQKFSARALHKLEKLVQRMEKSIQSTTMHKFMILDRKFHFAIYENSPNAFLVETVASLWDRTSVSQFIFAWDSFRAVDSLKEHKDILGAISRKEAQLAGALVRQHKDRSLVRLTRVLTAK